jgi:hypothetical protein
MFLFVTLPFVGGWIGYEYGVKDTKTDSNYSQTSHGQAPQKTFNTSVLIGDILNLDRSKVWSIGYAANQNIAGEYGYSGDIVSGILLSASTNVEDGRADTFVTPEGAEYIRLVTTFLKDQGYEQVDFYEGRPGSFGSLFKLDEGLYLKLRGWWLGPDPRVVSGLVPAQFDYEIFITDINDPSLPPQHPAVEKMFTETLSADAKTFFSDRHGVGFSYVSSPCTNESTSPWGGLSCASYPEGVRVYETRNQIYVGSQYISVYEKDSQITLQAAINERSLTQENAEECSFEPSNLSFLEQYEHIRLVSNEQCEIVMPGVFIMNPAVPDKFLYVIVGQEPYLPSGSLENPSELWQESIRIVD